MVKVLNLNAEPMFENLITTSTAKKTVKKRVNSPNPKTKQKSRKKPKKDFVEFFSSQFIMTTDKSNKDLRETELKSVSSLYNDG